MIAADGGTGDHVALSHDDRGNEERVVVVLLVAGEDEVVQDLATRDGAIVAHDGVDEACAILEVRIVAEDELHRRG